MQTTLMPLSTVVYSYLFFISMCAITIILGALAFMTVQCVLCNGVPTFIRFMKNGFKKEDR